MANVGGWAIVLVDPAGRSLSPRHFCSSSPQLDYQFSEKSSSSTCIYTHIQMYIMYVLCNFWSVCVCRHTPFFSLFFFLFREQHMYLCWSIHSTYQVPMTHWSNGLIEVCLGCIADGDKEIPGSRTMISAFFHVSYLWHVWLPHAAGKGRTGGGFVSLWICCLQVNEVRLAKQCLKIGHPNPRLKLMGSRVIDQAWTQL